MTHYEGSPEPARNPEDLLGGPDRPEYESEFGGPDPADRKDVLGGPDRSGYASEFGGPDPVGQQDVLGGADPDGSEDELRPPAGAEEHHDEESRATNGHWAGHHD
jgi:hypothetical protein